MEPLGYHIVFRARNSRILAPDVPSQRTITRILLRLGAGFGLVAFRASGDHLHTELLADRANAGRFAQSVGSALTQTLGGPGFGMAWLEPMLDQRHVEHTFSYILTNTAHHGVGNDPTHEASAIGALLGLIAEPFGLVTRVRRHLPRTNRKQLLAVIGLQDLQPGVRLDLLADAAAGAVSLPELDESVAARLARAAAARCAAKEFRLGAIAEALGRSERSIRRMWAEPPAPALEYAILHRMGLRDALGAGALLTRVPEGGPRARAAAGGLQVG